MHNLSLKLGLSGKVPASGGGVPSSATRFWGPTDMTFNGSNELTAITDQIDSGYVSVTGAPTGNTTNGITMTKAGALANYITLGPDFWWSVETGPRSQNLTLLFKPTLSGFAAATIFVNTAAAGINVLAQNGSATALAENMTYSSIRLNGSVITPTTRDNLWDAVFAGTDWLTLSFLGFTHVSANGGTNVRLLSYSAGSNFQFDGLIGGLGVVSDAGDVPDMEAALAALVS